MTDPSKANQELLEENSLLKQRIQELEKSESKRKPMEEALRERNKELNCLYGISALFELPGISLDEILKRTVMLIPPAWQFPEITEASIALEGKIFQTARFRETSWMQTREVIVNGMPIGQVEVCYREEQQASDEGPFLKEERKLLNAIAERLGRITDRKRAEKEIQTLARFPSENPNPVLRIARDGTLLYINQAGLSLLPEWHLQVGQSVPSMLKDVVSEALNSRSALLLDLEQRERVYSFFITPIADEGYTNMYGRDITDRRRIEEALRDSENRYRELSIVDDLTQLYNSRHFYFQLKVLSRLGQVVKRCLRETDFAYRYGGEEFTILLPMTTSADGAVTAERIRTEFNNETFSPAPGQDVHVTVSIGLAQYKMKEEMKAFVHRVDQLMYQGKKNGKDRVCSESSP
ncbi:MAG: diguanylate cyclase [Deltaproteobacteria bacterium]|nr:diguanylate cyclase [Deltaproteobacteria bacterium]